MSSQRKREDDLLDFLFEVLIPVVIGTGVLLWIMRANGII